MIDGLAGSPPPPPHTCLQRRMKSAVSDAIFDKSVKQEEAGDGRFL